MSGKRSKAMQLIRESRPYVVIGSPCCTAFSAWQALNALKTKDPEKMRRAVARATKHIDFVVSVYREQLENGRYFFHEHPACATSWRLRSIEDLMQASEVGRVVGDQCQYGSQVLRGSARGQPVRKPIGFMSNSPEVLRALSKKCSGRDGVCYAPVEDVTPPAQAQSPLTPRSILESCARRCCSASQRKCGWTT